MAGRTRSQIAAPITFGHRIARWAQPLIALRGDLPAVRDRIARVQLGGAVGTNAAVAPEGPRIAAALAAELGLACSPPWHTDRTGLAALAGWCASVCGALGKMSGDLVLMGRSESAEAVAGTGGGSSTMPQKANPVAAETVLALARYVAALSTPMHLAAIHAEERDGAAWAMEWLALPQIVVATGACLRHAEALAGTIEADPDRMRAVLEIGGGSVMAEAARFVLARSLPYRDAEAIVKEAVRAAGDGRETLIEALGRLAPEGIDWRAALDPLAASAPAQASADGVFGTGAASDPGTKAET
jgi:3-carboxy-cis,cis-muconate cycloisomerase